MSADYPHFTCNLECSIDRWSKGNCIFNKDSIKNYGESYVFNARSPGCKYDCHVVFINLVDEDILSEEW